MAEPVRGCLARIGCLTLVLLAAAGGWAFRDRLSEWWERVEAARLGEPTEELAAEAEEKLRRLADDDPPAAIILREAELQSLVQYRLAPGLPAGVERPAIEVRDSTLVFSALLRLDRMPGVPAAEMLRAMLADTATLTAELAPSVIGVGQARVDVLALQAGSVVVLPVMIGPLLERIDIPGAYARGRGVVFPVPEELADVRILPGLVRLSTAGPRAGPAGEPRP